MSFFFLFFSFLFIYDDDNHNCLLSRRQPWRTLCGFPPTSDTVTLRIPNGSWRPDTVITDYEGTEMFVLLDQTQEMRSYEAVFGDLDGRRLACVKRHLMKQFWKDGYYFCTYQPNYPGQLPLKERDIDNKKVYPFSYLQVNPMKGRFFYRYFDAQGGLMPPRMRADNPWLGFMVVCCTPMVRTGKWTASFKRRNQNSPTIHVDQWRNCVDVGQGNDLLAALLMAYVFDRYQCQPLITVIGAEEDEELDDESLRTVDGMDNKKVQLSNMPYKDNPDEERKKPIRYEEDKDAPFEEEEEEEDNFVVSNKAQPQRQQQPSYYDDDDMHAPFEGEGDVELGKFQEDPIELNGDRTDSNNNHYVGNGTHGPMGHDWNKERSSDFLDDVVHNGNTQTQTSNATRQDHDDYFDSQGVPKIV
jgi:hypothetical protein